MDQLKEIVPQVLARPASKNGKSDLATRSQASLTATTRLQFSASMAALVAMKRSADLTPVQIEAWYAVLGHFPAPVLNAAVIELALTKDRFPEVGDLYAICRRSLPKEYVPMGSSDEGKPTKAEVRAVAERLGLEVI